MFHWNLAVFNMIHGLSGRSIFADLAAIFFAQYLPYLLVLGFFILVLRQSGARRKFYLFAEGTLAIIFASGVITGSIDFFYRTARPFAALGFSPLIAESGSSFPSGHMAWFFALAIIVLFVDRKWGVWYLTLSAMMGVARIYVGVHWPIDILAGILIGCVSAWFVHWLLKDVRAKIFPTESAARESVVGI